MQQRVAIIGAKNSAAKAALDCYRHGAQVTLVVRGATLSESIKYWIKPDLENRIKEGSIRAFFGSTVEEIRETSLRLATPGRAGGSAHRLRARDDRLPARLRVPGSLGITFADDGFRTPVFDEATFESARPGVFLAGTVCGGLKTNRWFIENGRFHAQQIVKHLAGQRTEAIPFASIHWKTEE